MQPFAIAIHGGAGADEPFIRLRIAEYEAGLRESAEAGYNVLKRGGSALDAVEAAVMALEDNYLFNAGRGSALNEEAKVQMDAAIMEGKDLRSGAVAMLESVKNPIRLAKTILEHTDQAFLGADGALKLAREKKLELRPFAYFATNHQYDKFLEESSKGSLLELLKKKMHGTTGAVALDKKGNIAAACSSGGTPGCLSGRIGDSCMIGSGYYANNKTCAVSATGDGEYIIRSTVAHSISAMIEYTGKSIQEICDHVVHEKNSGIEGDLGVVAIDPKGNIGIAFNSPRMHRAWIGADGRLHVAIY